jgi:hypothetical protein
MYGARLASFPLGNASSYTSKPRSYPNRFSSGKPETNAAVS